MVGFLMLNTMNTVVHRMLYVFVLSFKIAQGVEEHRAAVIALHHVWKKFGEIFRTLQGLGISRMFVYWALAWYRETGRTKDRPCIGCTCDICIQKWIHAMREHIRRNLLHKQKVMSRYMKISPRTMSCTRGIPKVSFPTL